MSTDLLRSSTHLSPSDALRLSQMSPDILQAQSWSMPWPISLLTTSDDPEKWMIYENLFYSCLRTGDNRSSFACLKQLRTRFGDTNERVMCLIGIYHEAIAPDDAALENLLKQYKDVIQEKPTNMVMRKRRIALLESMGRLSEATAALVELLDASPIDAEAWAELADLYFVQNLYPQAVFCLEEVLLVTPNAWNIHARLGEVLYVSALSSANGPTVKTMARAMRSFCRSIELCDDYLRGYYGLKLSTKMLLEASSKSNSVAPSMKETTDDESPLPLPATVEKLNELATSKLAEIIRKSSTNMKNWEGYEESEVIATRELLDRDSEVVPK